MRKVTAKCPGSCGELIQGWHGDSQKLVSYGIDSFSWATITEGFQKFSTADIKSKRAMEKSLERLGLPKSKARHLILHIYSELPVSKGMASSTADIAATCMATAAYFEKKLRLEDIIDICVDIERTDSTPFSSLTLFEQEFGKVRESSGWRPDFYVLVLEPEEEVITDVFHSEAVESHFYHQRFQFEKVYKQYQEAAVERNLFKLGNAALKSALLNQEILPKPYFEEILAIHDSCKLLGINVAHSGSVVGLMIDKKEKIRPIIKLITESQISEIYTKINVYRSCYQGVQLA